MPRDVREPSFLQLIFWVRSAVEWPSGLRRRVESCVFHPYRGFEYPPSPQKATFPQVLRVFATVQQVPGFFSSSLDSLAVAGVVMLC